MPPRPRARLVRTTLAGLLAAAALPAVAAAEDCPPQPSSQPFVQLGDDGSYFLAPGGDFEGETTPWETAGATGLVPADKPVALAGPQALALGEGASATSPAICVDDLREHLRFGAVASDDDDRLLVEAVDLTAGTTTRLATIDGEDFADGWNLTGEVRLADPLGVVADAPHEVRLRLTAERGGWLVDGIYVDPLVRR